MNNIKTKIRCAIYTRKSTEEGLDMEFNSLDAQREACEKYIQIHKHEGWEIVSDDYDDGGYSGGNTDRPALKRLISDIKAEQINVVVVYKIDRLSRSLLDFLNIMQLFDTHRISFVSVTQNFDTSSSMGKLMLNVLLSFAQFEREITGERIRDKIASSKRKGMWMGGPPPLGYDIKEKKLIVNEEEAHTVRLIFETFIMKRSMKLLVAELRRIGARTKLRTTCTGKQLGGNKFDPATLYKILNNPVYLGKIRHKGQLYEGQHEAILTQDAWDNVHKIMTISPHIRANETKRKVPSVLLGLLKCGGCGSSMSPKHTRKKGKKLYRYYVPSLHMKGKCESCPVKQISAPEIEGIVLDQLHTVFKTPELLIQVWKGATRQDDTITEEYIRESLFDIFPIWHELFPGEQQRLLELTLEKVVLAEDSVEVRVRSEGLYSLVREIKSLKFPNEATYERAVSTAGW
ncbi:MAG: recombinase family protein [Alphaproteobacteria bacterium]|nr:recombinase family protein [Alphaproteobacteria bacterium]